MKSIKKSLAASLISIMILSLIGCGNATPAMNEDVNNSANMQESEMPVEEINNRVEDIKDGGVATTDKPAETTASPEPTAAPEPTATPEPIATPEPTPPPHVHQWTETVTREAGCASEGEKKLVCECVEEKRESIPATGNHNWVENTTVVHHEALGHVEEVQVQTGTSAGYTVYTCGVCGAQFDTPSGVVDHCFGYLGADGNHAGARTVAYDYPGEPIYEVQSQWVVDQPAWDETVGTGTYTCSTCGATK